MIEEEVFDHRPKVKKNTLNILPSNPEVQEEERAVGTGRFPSWLHRKIPSGGNLFKTNSLLEKYRLNTVCEEAKCPNRMECYSRKTATFLILGKECTRNCGFCDIDFSKQPKAPEEDEPQRIAASVRELGLKHVVITMVARDDMQDGGALHLTKVIREIRNQNAGVGIEVLTSDFNGNMEALDLLLLERPEIFNHNIETVRELTPRVRHKATYDRTLQVLAYVKNKAPDLFLKSGMMVGLGETEDQVFETIRDLYHIGCDIITIGHYLQANKRKLIVKDFISPQQFKKYEEYGYSLGIKQMYCGPFVRSSYNAAEIQENINK
jgi:lipoyl synthase